MKPEYANTFGIRKVSGKDGEVLEVTLDIAYKYMETAMTVTPKGMENISTLYRRQPGFCLSHMVWICAGLRVGSTGAF